MHLSEKISEERESKIVMNIAEGNDRNRGIVCLCMLI